MNTNGHVFGDDRICRICGAHQSMAVTCARCLETNRSHKWKKLIYSKAYICLSCSITGVVQSDGEIVPQYVPNSGKSCQQLAMEGALK